MFLRKNALWMKKSRGYFEFSGQIYVQTLIAASSRVGCDVGAASAANPAIGGNTHPNFLRRALWSTAGTRQLAAGQLIVTRNVGFLILGGVTIDLSTLTLSGGYYQNSSAINIGTTISVTDKAVVDYTFLLPDMPEVPSSLDLYLTDANVNFNTAVNRTIPIPYGYTYQADLACIGLGGQGGTAYEDIYPDGWGGGGGSGGACCLTPSVSLSGLSTFYLDRSGTTGLSGTMSTRIRDTNSSGTIRVAAKNGLNGANAGNSNVGSGGSAIATGNSNNVGTIKYSSGAGTSGLNNGSGGRGGGAAGFTGNASSQNGNSPGGNGGDPTYSGNNFGGGAGGEESYGSGSQYLTPGRHLWRINFRTS